MVRIADGSLQIQTSSETPCATPWRGDVTLVASPLQTQGILTTISERVRFARRRFGRSDVSDCVAVLSGFSAILCSSRMRFVAFVNRCETATMIRCLMEAFEYIGGLPKAAFTDRMKSVLFEEMEGHVARWNPVFADCMASIGVAPRVCKPRTPQMK